MKEKIDSNWYLVYGIRRSTNMWTVKVINDCDFNISSPYNSVPTYTVSWRDSDNNVKYNAYLTHVKIGEIFNLKSGNVTTDMYRDESKIIYDALPDAIKFMEL